jgi:galactose mutarotase-like enzyme
LRGGETRVVLVPSLGGKITELFMGGREWLWTSDVIPLSRGIDGMSYLESGDSGGFDECFPTVSSCRVPGWVRAFGGIELPDHGELWSQEPQLSVRTAADGQRAIFTWRGVRLPYRLQRSVRVVPDGSVQMDYVLSNDGVDRLPFIWSTHPMFPLTPETRLLLPEGARLRVFARHEIELGEVRSEHRWPYVRGSGKVHDFVVPFGVAKKRLQAVRRPARGFGRAATGRQRAVDHVRSVAGDPPGDLDQQARLDPLSAGVALPQPRVRPLHRSPGLAERCAG